MFPLLRTRAARVLDVAVEFATLGEYRLADPIALATPARGATRRAEPAERLGGAQARPAARLVAAERFEGAAMRPAARLVAPEHLAGAAMRPAARLVAPASAAAVRLRPTPAPALVGPARSRVMPAAPAPAVTGPGRARAMPAAPLEDAGAIKQLALDFDGTVPRPAVRARGGAAPAAPQPCESPRR